MTQVESDAPPTKQENSPAQVLGAIINSFYPELIQSGRLAKERAQQALSALCALSAAIVAALFAGGIDTARTPVKLTVSIAVACWFLSAGLFAWAATPPNKAPYPAEPSPDELTQWALDTSTRMELVVERRLKYAIFSIFVALAMTFGSFLVFACYQDAPVWRKGTVSLNPASAKSVCGGRSPSVTYIQAAPQDGFTRLRITCQRQAENEMMILSSEILVVQYEGA